MSLPEWSDPEPIVLWSHPCRSGPAGSACLTIGSVRVEFDRFERSRQLEIVQLDPSDRGDSLTRLLMTKIGMIRGPFISAVGDLAILMSDRRYLVSALRWETRNYDTWLTAPDRCFVPERLISEPAAFNCLVLHALDCVIAAARLADQAALEIPGADAVWPTSLLAEIEHVVRTAKATTDDRIAIWHKGRLPTHPNPALEALETAARGVLTRLRHSLHDADSPVDANLLESLTQGLSSLIETCSRLDLAESAFRQYQADRLQQVIKLISTTPRQYGSLFEAFRDSQAMAKSALWLDAAATMTADGRLADLCRACAAKLWDAAAEALVFIRDIRRFTPDDWENVQLAMACSEAAYANVPCQGVTFFEQPATVWQLGLAPSANARPSGLPTTLLSDQPPVTSQGIQDAARYNGKRKRRK